jgi:cytosine/uracil/thiamine/allantoin permease
VYANPLFVTHILIWIADEGQQAIFGINPPSTFIDTPQAFTVVGAATGWVGFTSTGECSNPDSQVCRQESYESCAHVAIMRT